MIERIHQIQLLTPTVENIGLSTNGVRYGMVFNSGIVRDGLLFLIGNVVLKYVPRYLILNWFVTPYLCRSLKIYHDVSCSNALLLRNVVSMAIEEFRTVGDLQHCFGKVLLLYKHKLVFCWAFKDHWADAWIRNSVRDFFVAHCDDDKKRTDQNHIDKDSDNDSDNQLDATHDHDSLIHQSVLKWHVDPGLHHNLIMTDPSKDLEFKLSKKLLKWIYL
ncbi:hypothetical protein RFI_01006 [Reticulomyxa filosa]|uniref:Uncharacterized protein n=1 Tax=Reticulomyxa filosa TaxID=46433 RepID=X6PD73_RETFI|nr:hypothetical protein RFI_01006 [Reticulomyxa filosa]|eukprot:ETO36058.1 hypothetical protein RFI_01006 [Reticulomyxa filosa]